MSFKWTKEEKQHINNIAEQQIKKQVKQMKTESLYNQFNEFSNEFQKKTYSIMLMIISVLLWCAHTHTHSLKWIAQIAQVDCSLLVFISIGDG